MISTPKFGRALRLSSAHAKEGWWITCQSRHHESFINDPRYGDQFVKIRQTLFPDGKFPCSALITVSNFAHPGILIEIQSVAVID